MHSTAPAHNGLTSLSVVVPVCNGAVAIRRGVFETADGFGETYRWATHHKCWTLRQVIHTDIFLRATPWTRLILSRGALPNDLNLRWENRVSALSAVFLLLLLIFAPFEPWLLAAGPSIALIVLTCNWRLYRLFYRQRGLAFSLDAIALHWLHYVYTAAAFILIALALAWRSLATPVPAFKTPPAAHALLVRD